MAIKLSDHPDFVGKIRFIYNELMGGKFKELVDAGFAGPASADEYSDSLTDLLNGKKLTEIPDHALDEGYVFEIKNRSVGRYSIEIPFYVGGEESDIFGVFRTQDGNEIPLLKNLYLYGILIP